MEVGTKARVAFVLVDGLGRCGHPLAGIQVTRGGRQGAQSGCAHQRECERPDGPRGAWARVRDRHTCRCWASTPGSTTAAAAHPSRWAPARPWSRDHHLGLSGF